MNESSKAVLKYSDEAMFTAEEAKDTGGGDHRPRVRLLDAPSDPLGKLAHIAKAYQGKFLESYADITDEDRLYYIQDMEKNILGMPSEAVQFHFVLENVTRSFTHQLVRTRHASYAQESMRFAVKEDFPIQLPPSLVGTLSRKEWRDREVVDGPGLSSGYSQPEEKWLEYEERYASDKQRMRFKWDESIHATEDAYKALIDAGMPAEDARGLAPHAIVTKINWVVDLRALMATAGQRLCTQAQFEHREMWASLIQSIVDYGKTITYTRTVTEREYWSDPRLTENGIRPGNKLKTASEWQFEFLANRFKPVCYQTGRCQFRSDFDRYCNIRDRVEAFASNGIPPKEWAEGHHVDAPTVKGVQLNDPVYIPGIGPHEWLDPNAAISPTADWRSEEALNNIKGRR
ncbi:ThyX-like thymidylate synthase [Gordonia phage LilyPad]|nr:ThyX-like thymidylate synthase [Gordonia phage LilyPad]